MSTIKKRPRGRPKLDNPASENLSRVRITPKDLATFKRAAKKSKMNFSEWVRETLKKACKVNTKLLTTSEAASYLSINTQTLKQWRSIGSPGPNYIKVGYSVRYSKKDLDRWLKKQKVKVS